MRRIFKNRGSVTGSEWCNYESNTEISSAGQYGASCFFFIDVKINGGGVVAIFGDILLHVTSGVFLSICPIALGSSKY